jgi:hypothetical protein
MSDTESSEEAPEPTEEEATKPDIVINDPKAKKDDEKKGEESSESSGDSKDAKDAKDAKDTKEAGGESSDPSE